MKKLGAGRIWTGKHVRRSALDPEMEPPGGRKHHGGGAITGVIHRVGAKEAEGFFRASGWLH